MEEVIIPKAKFKEMVRTMERVEKLLQMQELISEPEAAVLLDVTQKTIQNYVSDGTIPPSAYSTGIRNKRFYYKSKLMGINL